MLDNLSIVQNQISVDSLGEVKNALPVVYTTLEKFVGKTITVRLSKAVTDALNDAGIPCHAELKRECIGGRYSSLEVIANNRSAVMDNGKEVYSQIYKREIRFTLLDKRLSDYERANVVNSQLDELIAQCSYTAEQFNSISDQVMALVSQIEELVKPLNRNNRDIIKRGVRGSVPPVVTDLFRR